MENLSKNDRTRYRILRQRYLHTPPSQAYRQLINRLGSLMVLRNKIRTWVSLSRDRQRAVADVLQEVIQEMLNSDRNMQKQMKWISQCTQDERVRNILLFTSLEEYCLRPIRNQPLLAYRFVNYLRRSQRGGMTQVPQQQMIRMISEEISGDEPDSSFSLLDNMAIESYQESETWEDQQLLRTKVQREFNDYLGEKLGEEAQQWLDLYLQGKTQDEISQIMNLPIKKVYRLREKIGYHAIKVFAIKKEFELVANWLGISFERSFGLTPSQWQGFYQDLSEQQKQLLDLLQQKKTVEEIAKLFNWKKSQVYNEWTQLYLTAQNLRND
jgi:DNA-directed RNA polymerase specialized sigma24 family protein